MRSPPPDAGLRGPNASTGPGRQRGSVLLLYPAAVLIVVVLAAIAVDSAIAFLGQREVANAVAAAANDAAGEGVGNSAFYQGNRIDLDPGAVQQVAVDRVTAALDRGRFQGLAVDVTVAPAPGPGCPPRVRVHASAKVATLFASAIPGAAHQTRVEASAVGVPRQAPAGC